MTPLRTCSLLCLAAAACHPSSSSPPLDSTLTTNLGLAGSLLGGERLRILLVSEAAEGRDLDADGDLDDHVAHLIDDYERTPRNTGLVIGRSRELYGRQMWIASTGSTLAFGVDESKTGGLDRNGDGDAEDDVLAYYDEDGDSVVNLGLAVKFVTTTAKLLAFDVLQGPDDYETEAFVHDLRTEETWSLGPDGALEVLSIAGEVVALRALEEELGDLNGDGDTLDSFAAFYDVAARSLDITRFLLQPSIEGEIWPPTFHRGLWSIVTSDARGMVHVLYDPATGAEHDLGTLLPLGNARGIEPFVVAELEGRGEPGEAPVVWLYDAARARLTSTGLAGVDVDDLGGRLVVSVDEGAQGEDLDRNGVLQGSVPVLHDPLTGNTRNLGLAGYVRVSETGLLIHALEALARRDWNGDGDREDTVLFTWDVRTEELVNTRLVPVAQVSALSNELALVALDEARRGDLNGDGDRDDRVLHVYEIGPRRLTNLGLAVPYEPPGGGSSSVYPVNEADQGQDLNGDGDLDDAVLHLTKVLFYA